MKTAWVMASVVVLILCIVCIAYTCWEVYQGSYGIVSWNFAGSLVFHAVAGIAGCYLLVRARAKEPAA